MTTTLEIKPATAADVPTILRLIRELAEYERASNDAVATEAQLEEVLFGAAPSAEVLIGREGTESVG
ncbi:MAG: N-acetyltransferase, partial [Sphingomonas sp.]|nr:N-acetyltransferase [Sphingomonas sp.]